MSASNIILTGMVVKHIRVNADNRKKIEALLRKQKRIDWELLSIPLALIIFAIIGLILVL